MTRSVLFLAAILAPALAAAAQTARSLEPEAHTVAPGSTIRLQLRTADTKAAPETFDQDRVAWFFLRGDGTQENMERVPMDPKAPGTILLPQQRPGMYIVGMDLKPRVEEVDAASLAAFAKARSDDEAFEGPEAGKVRLRRSESFKTLIRVGDKNQEFAGAAVAIGEGMQAAEIRLLMDPTALVLPSDLGIGVSLKGRELEETRVLVTCLATGKTREVEVEEETGHFRLTEPGRWRLEFHHLVPSHDDGADYDLTSATLTFEVPQPKQPAVKTPESKGEKK